MKVINKQKDALPASISLDDFGKAMQQQDFSTVSPHNRERAVFDHFVKIMGDTIQDGDKAREIKASRKLRQQLWR
jgi:hypothetical protein|tara:strand:+ start:317 stop:541 length:225 start_codon:yes stop_codon:yes gene_type:complete